ncbi:MAG: hypothetical protein SGPRY_007075 [Prymnesium sp.]
MPHSAEGSAMVSHSRSALTPHVILENLDLLRQLPSLVWELKLDLVRPHLLLSHLEGGCRDGGDEWDVIE